MSALKLFEVTQPTTGMVKHIAAPNMTVVHGYCNRRGWAGCIIDLSDAFSVDSEETGEAVLNGVNVILDEMGTTIAQRTENSYRHCGEEWEDVWDCGCNDDCPVCGAEIEPYESIYEEDEE